LGNLTNNRDVAKMSSRLGGIINRAALSGGIKPQRRMEADEKQKLLMGSESRIRT
jgi:hypothetical protein